MDMQDDEVKIKAEIEELKTGEEMEVKLKVEYVGVGVTVSFITSQVVVADDCLLSSANSNCCCCVSWTTGQHCFTP